MPAMTKIIPENDGICSLFLDWPCQ